MTIRIIGFVESTHANSMPGIIRVQVRGPGAQCDSPIILYVPNDQATEWVVGNAVEITAHAYKDKGIGP